MKIGISQIPQETPQWAKWMFRIVFAITTVATFIIASDPAIPDPLKVRIGVYLKGFDMLIYGFSKIFGVEIKPEEES
jgi:hypothetical protein